MFKSKLHSDTVTSVSFSGDDKWLASVSEDHSVKVWDIEGIDRGIEATLQWTTYPIHVRGASIEGVRGISEQNLKLIPGRRCCRDTCVHS